MFVLGLIGLVRAWRSGGDPLLRTLGVGAVLTILLYSKWAKWWGGYTYGPRLLADLGPVFVLAMLPLADRLIRRRAWQVLFALLTAWSVVAHAMGAFVDDHVTWNRRVDVEGHPDRLWPVGRQPAPEQHPSPLGPVTPTARATLTRLQPPRRLGGTSP